MVIVDKLENTEGKSPSENISITMVFLVCVCVCVSTIVYFLTPLMPMNL